MNYLPQEAHLTEYFKRPCFENPVIEKSNSSYGNYVIKLSETTFQFFWNKKQAETFLAKHLANIRSL